MEAKKRAIEKIVLSRRLSSTSKLTEETKLCSVALLQLQRKQLQALQQLHILHAVKISFASERLASKNENTQFFWETECQLANESMFVKNFRMSRNRFNRLCELLPGLRKCYKHLGETISLQKGIAVALYALGSEEEYRKIGKKFGVRVTTVLKIILKFCEEVWRVLAPIYLNNFPLTSEKIETSVEEFETLGFPQCMGSLDGCQIAIQPPSEGAEDNCNYDEEHSVVLLALVDARSRFIYVSCGNRGGCNDIQIFEESSLKQYLDHCSLLRDLKKTISGVDVPVLIIGDLAFQLSDTLLTPYPSEAVESQQQELFNYLLSKSQKVAKNAFGQLKMRFRRIAKGIDNAIRNSNAIILTCCVLHNFLNENNDIIKERSSETLQSTETNRSYREHHIFPTDLNNKPEAIRHAIASYLSGDVFGEGDSEDVDANGDSGGLDGDGGAEYSSFDGDGNGEDKDMDGDNGSVTIEQLMPE